MTTTAILHELSKAAANAVVTHPELRRKRLEVQARLLCAGAVDRALQLNHIPMDDEAIAESWLPERSGLTPTRILELARALNNEPASLTDTIVLLEALNCQLTIQVNHREDMGGVEAPFMYRSR